MAISTNQFKSGMALKLEGQLYIIVEYVHVKPGKGAAFVRTKLKNLKTGGVVAKTFDAGDKFEQAYIEKRQLQFMYAAGVEYHFMDMGSYEQQMLPGSDLGDSVNYLIENLEVRGDFYEDRLVGLELPTFVVLTVAESDPGLRGDTSKAAVKPATLETGLTVQVPLFIEPGEKVKIDTRTGEYLGRA